MPYSLDVGKREVVRWVRQHFELGETCLDVGAGSGTWGQLLGGYLEMDAVEIFWPNVQKFRLPELYSEVVVGDIADFQYFHYDLIIFGDVIEHMTVEKARKVLEYAIQRCKDLIVAVPFLYPQGPADGNEYERHIQDDLTPELVAQLYPMLELLHDTGTGYAYYHKAGAPK